MAHPRAPDGRAPVPGALLPVVAAVLLEAAALVVVALLAVRAVVAGEAVSGGLAAGVVVLSLLVAALLAAAARAVVYGRRWGRAPVLTWQLLQAAVAVPAVQSDRPLAPVLLLAASVLVGVGLFWPSVVRHTAGGGEPPAL